jgi:hypothetical protein
MRSIPTCGLVHAVRSPISCVALTFLWVASGAGGRCLADAVAGRPVFIDPAAAAADPDFAVQGEYEGDVMVDFEEARVGVQVIARGEGRFEVVAYPGGLPGTGWDEGDVFRGTAARERDGAAATVEVQDGYGVTRRAEIRDGVLIVRGEDGSEAGRLARVERTSPTLGLEPPEGAVVIFDGPGPADESATLSGGRITEDGLLCEGVVTAAEFGDARWHIEFRLPFQPHDEGQQRANSGAYLGGCYEVQILDSFGLEGLSNECGGIYGASAPLVNMCLPPLTWQTYDIDYTAPRFEDGRKVANARMTVRHNGVLIHDDRELPTMTPGGPKQEEGPAGPLYLQDHGNPVRFRNVWVKPKG